MIYYDNLNILIEIKKYKKNTNDCFYVIGNKKFEQIPKSIIDNSYNIPNWNRALKFYCDYNISNEIILETYYMLNFDIYIDFENKKLKLLSKDTFFNNIINNEYFINNFLYRLLCQRHKHIYLNDKKEINIYEILKKYPINKTFDIYRIDSFDNFLICDNYLTETKNFDKYKFKNLFLLTKFDNKIETTNKNQIIFHINKNNILKEFDILNNITFLDITNQKYYINTMLNLDFSFLIEYYFEDVLLTYKILNYLILQVKNIIKDNTQNFYIYNFTNDENYLNKGIIFYFENYNFQNALLELENIFKEIKINYLPIIFNNKKTLELIKKYILTTEDETIFNEKIDRYI